MCLNPRIIVQKSRLNKQAADDAPRVYGAKRAYFVPCGKCVECLKRYQNDWTIRNYFQFLDTKVAVFFTLTYNDDSVPLAGSLDENVAKSVFKSDVTTFLHSFREYCRYNGISTDWKYFITSEYGPLTLRPHYHGLIHGITLSQFRPFVSKWQKEFGFTMQREICIIDQKNALNSARYVAKYCAKGQFENPLIASGSVYPSFHLISKGLGKYYLSPAKIRYHKALDFPNKFNIDGTFATAYLDEIIKRSCVSIPPCTYALPRYYKDAVFKHSSRLSDALKVRISDRLCDEYERKLGQLQTDDSNRSRFEASVRLYSQTLDEEKIREATARESVAKFYKHSKI